MLLAAAAPASGQTNQAAATAQFDRGRELMKQKSYAEACTAFETSQKLDPQHGTLFNLADCNAHLGKLATSWLAYRDLSQRDSNPGRKKEAARRAKELERRLPRLFLDVSSPPQGLVITVNGDNATAAAGIPSPVDLGAIRIRATAPGYAPFEITKNITVEGKTVTVEIELERASGATTLDTSTASSGEDGPTAATAPPAAQPRDDSHGDGSHRRRNAVIVAVVGGALVVTGGAFALSARSSWNDAQTLCPAHMCGTEDDHLRGNELVDSARTSATLATGFMLGGAAITAFGVYYAVTARRDQTTSLRVVPTPTGAMATFGGAF